MWLPVSFGRLFLPADEQSLVHSFTIDHRLRYATRRIPQPTRETLALAFSCPNYLELLGTILVKK